MHVEKSSAEKITHKQWVKKKSSNHHFSNGLPLIDLSFSYQKNCVCLYMPSKHQRKCSQIVFGILPVC